MRWFGGITRGFAAVFNFARPIALTTGRSSRNNTHGEDSLDRQTKSAAGSRPFGTSVFLGCSDIDPHIPLERVHETSRVLSVYGAVVTERIYPGMGHAINDDEIRHIRAILASFATRSAASSSL
jgi:hypothetical protein